MELHQELETLSTRNCRRIGQVSTIYVVQRLVFRAADVKAVGENADGHAIAVESRLVCNSGAKHCGSLPGHRACMGDSTMRKMHRCHTAHLRNLLCRGDRKISCKNAIPVCGIVGNNRSTYLTEGVLDCRQRGTGVEINICKNAVLRIYLQAKDRGNLLAGQRWDYGFNTPQVDPGLPLRQSFSIKFDEFTPAESETLGNVFPYLSKQRCDSK